MQDATIYNLMVCVCLSESLKGTELCGIYYQLYSQDYEFR